MHTVAQNENRGAFITFEGVEGCGKSTQAALLADALERAGIPVARTREPGGTPLAEALRALVLDGDAMPPEGELFLYLAARCDHVARVIRPQLERGTWVVCDRFTDATIAYQGFGRRLDVERVRDTARWAETVHPDLTLLLDVPVGLSLKRVAGRGAANRMDREGGPFHERVRQGYLELAHRDPERIALIDARGPVNQVHQAVLREVLSRLDTELEPRAEAAS